MRKKVYIVAAKRTAMGSFGSSLATVSSTELGATVIKAVMDEIKLEKHHVDEVYMGSVLQANLGQAPARQASKFAGLPDHVPATTINKVCASGMKAISIGVQQILLGDAQVVIAGGMENMSQVPFYDTAARWGAKYGDQKLTDGIQKDGLTDVYSDKAMGNCGELCAEKYEISRADQDEYAIQSYTRSKIAWETGKFKNEVVPVEVKSRKGSVMVDEDEEFKNINFEKVSQLKTSFKTDGTITAANASTLSDGAAAVILMSEEKVNELGVKPLAEVIAYADAEQSPEWFTTTPTAATQKVLQKVGLTVDDIDYFEFNEAFSVVALANAKLLDISEDQMNVYGGAVSLGHPLGCSGARIIVTLTSVLHQENGQLGLAAICNGGGGASAMILKKI
ncbi:MULTISPECIES: thiolase family protein [unclassified Sphingobacterium]|uniref:thiolase family protein n=1 Tax=unclassified Sphingobacterium TaxID=2609468 RepID=UPI0020C4A863|nr:MULTISPECIES: thiolase family protein [unclassified Sphingobacterium]MBV2226160.1 thiolase family protein [Sphingobacterium mizutaii]